MACPMFVYFTRECVEDINTLPPEVYEYCKSDDYHICPFYLKKQKQKTTCEYIDKCNFFNNFDIDNFQKFIEVTKNYCFSDKHIKCNRYKLRSSGKEVPIDIKP